MKENTNVEFPGFASEETYIFGLTMSEAALFIGTMGGVFVTRQVIIPAFIGIALWRMYKLYKEKGQANILAQLAYRFGIYVPDSHIFPEPEVDSFRN
jgi:hypothetical protein